MLFRNDEKARFDRNFSSGEQIGAEMDVLLKHYGANKSQADLDKTHKILKRFGSITNELAVMHDENR